MAAGLRVYPVDGARRRQVMGADEHQYGNGNGGKRMGCVEPMGSSALLDFDLLRMVVDAFLWPLARQLFLGESTGAAGA